MRGSAEVITLLNEVLTSELTAINQYYVHYKMCENWGYSKLAAHLREESIEEMKHADKLIERILFLEGIPNMQRLNPIKVGETVPEQMKVDLELEVAAVDRLNSGIKLCDEKSDAGTREILEHMLEQEEHAVDWHEAQLNLISEIGKERYLAEQM